MKGIAGSRLAAVSGNPKSRDKLVLCEFSTEFFKLIAYVLLPNYL